MAYQKIQFRRGTAAQWTAVNPVLAAGEMGLETDTTKFKVGDGTTAWNSLSYGPIAGTPADNSVTAAKLTTDAVTTTKIQNNAVTQAKLSSTLSGVTICTSSTKPGSPFDGQVIYMTDVDQTAVWDGSQWTVLAPIAGGRNKVINGGMSVWQRGTSFSNPAAYAYTADRWIIEHDGTGATRTISQQTFTPGAAPVSGYESQYFLRYAVSVAGTGNTYQFVGQRIEDVRTLAGQTVTISFWAKADTTRTITVGCDQVFGSGGSSAAVGFSGTANVTTSWQRFTITGSLPSLSGKTIGTSSFVTLYFKAPALSTCTIDYWGVQLEAGAVATPFEFEDYGTTLSKCERYFRLIKSPGTELAINSGFYFDSNLTRYPYHFPTMRSAPVVTYVGTANTDYKVLQNGGAQTGFTFTYEKSGPNSVVFSADKTSHGLTNSPSLVLAIFPTGAIWLSAEL